jgi:hypothetical protein
VVAQQLQLQVELAIVLLPIYLILVVLVRVHLKQVLVVIGTQVDNIAELSMEVMKAVEVMTVVLLEVEPLLYTRIQMHLAIIK